MSHRVWQVQCVTDNEPDALYAVITITDEVRSKVRSRRAAFLAAHAQDNSLDEMRYLHDYAAIYFPDEDTSGGPMGSNRREIGERTAASVKEEDSERTELDTMIIEQDQVSWAAMRKGGEGWHHTPAFTYADILGEDKEPAL